MTGVRAGAETAPETASGAGTRIGAGGNAARPFADPALYRALARALAGAVLFGLPLLMTAEMWTLGFTMRPERLALMLALTVPLLAGLAYYGGFRHNVGVADSIVDGFVAFALGAVGAGIVLFAFGVLDAGSSLEEIVATVALETVPAAMGAALASSQLGLRDEDADEADERARDWGGSYAGELFLMVAGALFFAFNVAPTEEVVMIALAQGNPAHAIALLGASLALLHAFVYALDFRGRHEEAHGPARLPAFWSLSVPGFALVLLTCLLVLWLFGRIDGLEPAQALHMTAVLGLPGALGAATARLVL